ncbi:MAG: Asp-tRNA(Asn)/Glu-tRNA(Gln) amidotransferase subunit GatB [Candidatus Omnitrophica bacterium]|jgi:aspartyl-tRNA(Asn)/glutamyl-tRNA(Gln) amidotransferase subunit B|nr:Asp-tRNA(Asn)/Glu-tRNA(Gln) amidotransferase subunit GatB [Candidatus Omnitrophota bacterium]
MNYQPVIGLEVHVHLKTKSKAFCACSTEFGKSPNSQTCPVCLGFPGSLPVLNETALDFAIKTGLALNCKINEFTKFDRKNYFYPDLPKNYQISQYDLPVAGKGFLKITLDGKTRRIGITRAHLEEDAGKLIHKSSSSLVDFNRAGVPLLEIVSDPDMHSPQEAYEYLSTLKSILEYLEVSDCDMEKGSLRCDANVSIRPEGSKELGVKTEIKNMNSFKGVKDALEYQIKRQIKMSEAGEKILQETLLWDAKTMTTSSMRSKEEAKDYRYFPEPDLPPFIIASNKIQKIKETIPELPQEKIKRFMKEYATSEYEAKILCASHKFAAAAESAIARYPIKNKKAMINWYIGPVLEEAGKLNTPPHLLEIPGGNEELIKLVQFIEEEKISNLTAKSVFSRSIAAKKPASQIIQEESLFQISDASELESKIDQVIKENTASVNDYKAGKTNALMFLVGQVMKKSKGKANPKIAQELLKRRLDNA